MQWNEFRSHIRHLPEKDQKRVEEAFVLGRRVHGGQLRKSGEPYFMHPIAVADMLADLSADADTIIAALLHDTVEDTPLTLKEIHAQFGSDVTTLIDGATKLSVEELGTNTSLNEQVESLRKIFTLMQQDVRIMIIKLYDRLHNMQTAEFLPEHRRMALAQETFDVYVKIADRLCMQDLRDELEGLCYAVLHPDVYEQLVTLRLENEQKGQRIVQQIHTAIRTQRPETPSTYSVHFEHKIWEQLFATTHANAISTDSISDVTMVFVTDTIEHCYVLLGALHQLWQRQIQSFQDFINAPSVNGYCGVHTTIILPDGTRVRCKIRTKDMHEYARKGITTICFTQREEVSKTLKWTHRIAPLSTDTEGSSDDFWETLKSEILGESIIIHGPGDETVQVPKGSSALDGAFYIYQEKALYTSSITINGLTVDLKTPLQYACSLDVTFQEKPTVNRQWLVWSKTGMATAHIHTALASQPLEQKMQVGRLALQQSMIEKDKGLLEEFDADKLSHTLLQKGFGSLEAAYSNIAEGRVKPADIIQALFGHAGKKQDLTMQKEKYYEISFSLQKNNSESFRQFMNLAQKYSIAWRTIHIRDEASQMLRISLTTWLSEANMLLVEKELIEIGALRIDAFIKRQREVLLLLTIVALWGLNPVIATWFLGHGVTLLTLLSFRMIIFCVCSLVFFMGWRAVFGKRLTSIPGVIKLALLPAISTIALATFTYQALFLMPPSVHLTIIRCNVLLLPIVRGISGNKAHKSIAIIVIGLFALSCYFLIHSPSYTTSIGIIFSLLALCAYIFYSLIIERTLQENHIGLRYPYLLSVTGLCLGAFGLALLPFIQLQQLSPAIATLIIFYVIACVFVPHACYYALLNTRQSKRTNDLFFLEVPIAILAEVFVLNIIVSPILYALVILSLIGIILLRWRHKIRLFM